MFLNNIIGRGKTCSLNSIPLTQNLRKNFWFKDPWGHGGRHPWDPVLHHGNSQEPFPVHSLNFPGMDSKSQDFLRFRYCKVRINVLTCTWPTSQITPISRSLLTSVSRKLGNLVKMARLQTATSCRGTPVPGRFVNLPDNIRVFLVGAMLLWLSTQWDCLPPCISAVSYTHLTLPTICSV